MTTLLRKTALYIDGAWRPTDAPPMTVFHASTGQPLAEIPGAGPEIVDIAVKAASKALPAWAALAPDARAEILEKIADGLARRAEEIARMITAEVGMPLRLSGRIQVGAPIEAWRACARYARGAGVPSAIGNSRIFNEPVGVVAAITPWNYPLHQITAKVAAALAAGATVVLKPSEVAPLSAFALADVMDEAGLPAGVFNLVTGLGGVVGEALVRHPLVAMVSFTGSTAAGIRVATLAAGGLKRVGLELGGKSASVVLDGADLKKAVRSTLGSCFLNSGQTCNALTRLIVPEGRFEEIAGLIRESLPGFTIGDPMDPSTRLGPLASAAQAKRVTDLVSAARAAGVPLIAGLDLPAGLPDGYFVAPAVFGPVAEDSDLVQEEIFGPVLAVQTHGGEAEAIRLANGTRYGLAASVWAPDEASALRVAAQLRAGQVDVNGAAFNLEAPFGGYGHSGIGRENGPLGLRAFQELKSIQVP